MEEMLGTFSYLWDEEKSDYVLLRVHGEYRTRLDHYLIYNIKEHSRLLIEDDEVAHRVMQNMRDAGVPVVDRSELPAGENRLERQINDMLEAGKGPSDINEAIREYELNQTKKRTKKRGQVLFSGERVD